MGNLWSYLWSSKSAEFTNDPSLDVADPNIGLTGRQKLVIRETWSRFKEHLQENGVKFFLALFKAQPHLQLYFGSLAKLSHDELLTSKRLQAHSTTAMMGVTGLVDNLDDVECLRELLLKIGENHGKRKIKIDDFEKLVVVFVDFFEETQGADFTPFARKAWTEVFKLMISIFAEGMKRVEVVS